MKTRTRRGASAWEFIFILGLMFSFGAIITGIKAMKGNKYSDVDTYIEYKNKQYAEDAQRRRQEEALRMKQVLEMMKTERRW